MALKDVAVIPAESCGHCRYARGKLSFPALPGTTRKCVRFPPQVTGLMVPGPPGKGPVVMAHSDWPVVEPDNYCGEFALPKGLIQ